MDKCLCFDCYAGFSPDMAAGAILDIVSNLPHTNNFIKNCELNTQRVTRSGMEAIAYLPRSVCETQYLKSDEILRKTDMFDISPKTKKSLGHMMAILAEAFFVYPEDAVFEVSELLPQLECAAIVFEATDIMGIKNIYCPSVFTSDRDGLFGSFTSSETNYICQKYELVTRSLPAECEIFPASGAALLAELSAKPVTHIPHIIKCGYGAGKTELIESANILRAVFGYDGENAVLNMQTASNPMSKSSTV